MFVLCKQNIYILLSNQQEADIHNEHTLSVTIGYMNRNNTVVKPNP